MKYGGLQACDVFFKKWYNYVWAINVTSEIKDKSSLARSKKNSNAHLCTVSSSVSATPSFAFSNSSVKVLNSLDH